MGMGSRILVIMTAITIALTLGGYTNLPLQDSGVIPYSYNSTSGNATVTETSAGLMTNNGSVITGVPMFGFFNTFSLVYHTVSLLLSIFFAPVVTLVNVGAPGVLVLAVGLIWTLMYLIAIMSFIRGYEF